MGWNFIGGRPIYAQLVEQIQLKILSGEYTAGQRLPSIRELAAEASVNPNTLQRAFTELEAAELVYTQRTAGRFITEDEERIKEIRRRYAEKSVREFITQTRALGYSPKEIIALFTDILEEEERQ